jgi:O-antigen/teichoic acid export membrane protein
VIQFTKPSKDVRAWLSLISQFFTLGIIEKVILLVSGTLLIRLMDKQDYAEFTIANSILAGLVVLASTGVEPAMLAIGGARIGDSAKMGGLISTAQRYRYFLAILLAPLPLIFAVTLLKKVGAPSLSIVLILGLLVALLVNALTASPYRLTLSLARKHNFPKIASIGGSASRLLLIVLAAWISNVTTALVLLLTLMAQFLWVHFYLRRKALKFYMPSRPREPGLIGIFRKQTFRLLPEGLSAFVLPQVMVFLIAFWGNSDSVAEIGALSRIALVFSIVSSFNSVFVARLATTPLGRPLLRNTLYFFVFALISSACFVSFVYLFSPYILSILGPGYLHLDHELLLYCINTSILYIFSCVRTPLMAKGWTDYFWVFPIVHVLSLAFCIPFFDLSNLSSVLTMDIMRQFPAGVVSLLLLAMQFRKHKPTTQSSNL